MSRLFRATRPLAAALALALALALGPARPAVAADAQATIALSPVRVAAWFVKRWGPYVLAFVTELLERLPGAGDPPPPPPDVPPTDVPPTGDPDFTP